MSDIKGTIELVFSKALSVFVPGFQEFGSFPDNPSHFLTGKHARGSLQLPEDLGGLDPVPIPPNGAQAADLLNESGDQFHKQRCFSRGALTEGETLFVESHMYE